MRNRLKLLKPLLPIVLTVGVLLGFMLFCPRSDAILYTYGAKVQVTQIFASREGKEEMDPNIPKGIASYLKAKFKRRYKNYTYINTETQAGGFGEELTFLLTYDKTLILTSVSHRERWINLKLQLDFQIQLMKVSSGKYGSAVVGIPEKGTLILVIQPSLIQAKR